MTRSENLSIGRFNLLGKVANGGMAEIMIATPQEIFEGDPEFVIVKKIRPDFADDQTYIDMLLDEARVLTCLEHPNIVRFLECGSQQGTPYIAMEYVEGLDLEVLSKRCGKRAISIPIAFTVNVLHLVCGGLAYAHARRDINGKFLHLVHRDVTPHNVVVGFDGVVKILDFGIAKATNRKVSTKTGTLKGKLAYMAPEQLALETLDARTDIFACGVMLYELTTGRHLFRRKSDVETMRAVMAGKIERPSSFVSSYPKALEAIVMKALAREKKDRFSSALEMSRALKKYWLSLSAEQQQRGDAATFLNRHFSEQRAMVEGRRAEWLDRVKPYEEIEQVPIDLDLLSIRHTAPPPVPENARGKLIEQVNAGGVTLRKWRFKEIEAVEIAGKIDESFEANAFRKFTETADIFAMQDVTRITSFGIRMWLNAMEQIRSEGRQPWITNCSDSVLSQLTTFRSFSGPCLIASLLLEYEHADTNIRLSVNAFLDPIESISRTYNGQIVVAADDRGFIEAAFELLEKAPTRIITIGDWLNDRNSTSVEKTVNDRSTTILVRGDVPEPAQWRRVFVGLEGKVILRFEHGVRLSADSVQAINRSIRSAIDVTSWIYEGVPEGVNLESAILKMDVLTSLPKLVKAPKTTQETKEGMPMVIPIGLGLLLGLIGFLLLLVFE